MKWGTYDMKFAKNSALALVFSMALVVTGCGQKAPAAESDASTSTSTAASTPAETEQN